ncbi:MAG TPA: alpha/beta hydrolase [Acidimicrobiales bacterium]|nr:alpha/beta hydrolase [Acidimicrobiales bacterium]
MEERSFVDSHGVEVFTYWWPVAEPKGIVVISHGASEHAARYDRFALALNAAGFAAAGIDHRGHGRTAASTGGGRMGAGGGDAVIDDLHELRLAAEASVGAGVPTFLFGHSLGSLFGLAYLTRHSAGLAGGILCGFPADPGGASSMRDLMQTMATPDTRDQPLESLGDFNSAIEGARTSADWLSRDEAEVDKYIADPMCGDGNPLTYGYVADFFGLVAQAADQLGDIRCPMLVIAGDQDPAAAMGAHPAALAEALKGAGVTADLTLYPGARHELLNETNRDDVTADIVGWLEARL